MYPTERRFRGSPLPAFVDLRLRRWLWYARRHTAETATDSRGAVPHGEVVVSRATHNCRRATAMLPQSVMKWRTELLALSLLMATFSGCVEESRSRGVTSGQPGDAPVKLVDPLDPQAAPKIVPGVIQPPHATDGMPG